MINLFLFFLFVLSTFFMIASRYTKSRNSKYLFNVLLWTIVLVCILMIYVKNDIDESRLKSEIYTILKLDDRVSENKFYLELENSYVFCVVDSLIPYKQINANKEFVEFIETKSGIPTLTQIYRENKKFKHTEYFIVKIPK